MKQIFTLIFTSLLLNAATTKAQVVLNEIYTAPNSGKNEFFELYNTSTSSIPISLDGYTIMSYFEEGSKKGFYILDLPNLFVGPKDFFIGASAMPFSYQGNTNSTAANFSWNDPQLSLNFGYLQKWTDNGANLADGNKNYDVESLTSNLNDFFSARSGSGATYNAFVYKNGVLINAFFGGAGGTNSMPSFITTMPNLKVNNITAAGTNNFQINFNSYKNKPAEFVSQDAGTDNGFIRSKDGLCGTWKKSSADVTHTPGISNGKSGGTNGVLNISYSLFRNVSPDSSVVVYDIESGPEGSFPVELQLYKDNGSVPGELDGNDAFLALQVENQVTDGEFTTKFSPAQTDLLLVAKVAAGCLDQVIYITDGASKLPIVLPMKILSFQGSRAQTAVELQWNIAENETGDRFEIQRSFDGREFSTVGVLLTTEKSGVETYKFKDSQQSDVIYYRLKAINKDNSIAYSEIIVLKGKQDASNRIALLQNPANENLTFTYTSSKTSIVEITIFSIFGGKISSSRANFTNGNNTFSLPLNSTMVAGTYILEVKNNSERTITKFIKQ